MQIDDRWPTTELATASTTVAVESRHIGSLSCALDKGLSLATRVFVSTLAFPYVLPTDGTVVTETGWAMRCLSAAEEDDTITVLTFDVMNVAGTDVGTDVGLRIGGTGGTACCVTSDLGESIRFVEVRGTVSAVRP